MTKLPSKDAMYRALVHHDASYEGIFFVGVTTTGVFCRPTCRVRTPKRENVEFFASARDALHAGFRPCRRCQPLDHGHKPPALVERLLAAVEDDPSGRLRDADLERLGIDPSTARRAFMRYCGMTFHAYHRARRMGLALAGVRKGTSMLDLQLDQGFESGSGFRAAFKGLLGTAPSRAANVDCLYARWLETPLGPMLALADEQGLALLEFVDRRGLERELQTLQRKLKRAILPGENRHLAQIERELEAYFAGRALRFETPIVLSGSPFQRAVWNALIAIPPGTTRSYAEIAAAIGEAKAVRAVGRANGDNKLCLIVPCHRVIGADGTLTGYGGGLWRKQWLLDHERTLAGARGQLALDVPPAQRPEAVLAAG
ncbi:MAG TPA: trifunctional transcriptional activator/DNA repair protein Ada/methylated-DNA--[protein]-cysteine S-methyltransferase [Casimicrobiaceae bacterium]|jgi:AraC family transcriptional regulator of adaptative response/methylated-DNA-[protein]-cysteine methyltransferase|nr:trifunctional transcriptional activator/DNA repair protein Ada/methylated-DNA--[protein]-cysteine S-methyltransferase [Casimicrobiaceae bacterium]